MYFLALVYATYLVHLFLLYFIIIKLPYSFIIESLQFIWAQILIVISIIMEIIILTLI
jgi:hypothetical protein